MDDALARLIADFTDEAWPMAEELADLFCEIDLRFAANKPVDEQVSKVKSGLHTIKGNAGMMGLTAIQSLSHALEDLCGLIARRPALRVGTVSERLLAGGELLLALIQRVEADTLEPGQAVPAVDAMIQFVVSAKAGEVADGSVQVKETLAAPSSKASAPETVRIDFRKLDRLMELVGEAIVSAESLKETLEADFRGSRPLEDLEGALKRLQQGLVESRLLPVDTVFRRYTRSAREQARKAGKRVRVETVGGDTTIDKAIIDRLGDPLLHLVRNAIAHGVEEPEEREAAGKNGEARLQLAAEQRSDRVWISVSDDGRGIDDRHIRRRAAEQGIDTTGMGSSELRGLLFHQGFSTADEVSTLAGRGVGLEVVATTIEALGGSLSIDTELGRGTCFAIDLPLTMAVVRVLVVVVDGERYAVPLGSVLESLRASEAEIGHAEGRPLLRWRGDLLPLIDGGQLLGSDANGSRDHIVVLTGLSHRCAVRVDQLVAHQELVAKTLDGGIAEQGVISGGAVTGTGNVILILDPARIAGGWGGSSDRRVIEGGTR